MSQLAFAFSDDDQPVWPPQDRFPINWNKQQVHRKVSSVLDPDLKRSNSFLIITGFLSLGHIIDTFGSDEFDDQKRVRILLGFEPEVRHRKKFARAALDQQIKDHWLEQSISPLKCGVIIRTIELIKAGKLSFKILDRMHGKIYVGDSHVILGSSNFSRNGLNFQTEANVRFARDGESLEERGRYDDARQIAENYFAEGHDFSDQIAQLLGEMLKIVDWDEALARAIAEVLEGKWLKDYAAIYGHLDKLQLWPCQFQGVARGLQILRTQGNLLVADPTGSGKTRMVSALQLALQHWLWSKGQGDRAKMTVICPAVIADNWEREHVELDLESRSPLSVGILQQKEGKRKTLAQKRIAKSRILILDEAHNYLNPGSNRSQALRAHEADHVILATATPINRRAEDLLRLIEMLDPDNLSDQELIEYKAFRKQRPLIAGEDTIQRLRSYIWKFTLRRTKKDINLLVDKHPEAYTNALGEQCRYPRHEPVTYATGETEADIAAAREIRKIGGSLKGLIYLKQIHMPRDRRLATDQDKVNYIKGRIGAAGALAWFRLHASLRSSRAALIEHILGTHTACQQYGLKEAGKSTGDMAGTLRRMRETMPVIAAAFKDLVPSWLRVPEEYQRACDHERAAYERIAEITVTISDARERTKANIVQQAVARYGLVLAFDHTIITLHYLASHLGRMKAIPHIIATGGRDRDQEKVKELFKIGSQVDRMVALCSDSMAEGVNLQQASAVVLLDMPSVLRLAEQRIGRVDRLDSPHEKIKVYWPGDDPEFALRSDRNLYRTSTLTDKLLGGNLELPSEFIDKYEQVHDQAVIDPIEAAKLLEQAEEFQWEGVNDAFSDVVALMSGLNALITPEVYAEMKGSNATVRCKLSFTSSSIPWAFFSIRGSSERSPKWIFIHDDGRVTTEYAEVCALLREHLQDTVPVKMAPEELQRFTNIFQENERRTLPHKKRRALEVAERMLRKQLKREVGSNGRDQFLITDVIRLFGAQEEGSAVDMEMFASTWLQLLIPKLQARRDAAKRKRDFISIGDLAAHYKEAYFAREELERVRNTVEFTVPLDQQLAACIIGVRE